MVALFGFSCLALLGMLAMATGSANAADAKAPQVVLDTNYGPITLELDTAKAPITVANFLKHVDAKHYDGVIFHRVIPGFMIQGGGFDENGREKESGPTIKNEGGNGLRNKRGTVAMARTSVPDSAKAQFFINLKDNGFLDRDQSQDGFGYAVFGKVVDGMDAVDKIAAVKTGPTRMGDDTPVEAVTIKTARRK